MFWVISDLGHISSFLYNLESWWIALNLLLLYFGLRKRDDEIDELRKWVKGGRALRIHAAKLPSLEIHPGKFIGTYGRLYVSKSTVNWMLQLAFICGRSQPIQCSSYINDGILHRLIPQEMAFSFEDLSQSKFKLSLTLEYFSIWFIQFSIYYVPTYRTRTYLYFK